MNAKKTKNFLISFGIGLLFAMIADIAVASNAPKLVIAFIVLAGALFVTHGLPFLSAFRD